MNFVKTVGEITRELKNLLEDEFNNIEIKGEISNYKLHSSGHRYFTLKDEDAQLSCVMWKSKYINFEPKDGQMIIAKGTITVYPPRGNYQLDCSNLSLSGEGDLFRAFEEMKIKLQSEGLFDEVNKKNIPKINYKIGLITSPTGAAIQDILNTLTRRFPFCEVLLHSTAVQGENSEIEIAQAINTLSTSDCSVILLCRGGGSIEDLWAFNTEVVARAIFECKIPIISGIGHQTDFTIADFVADLRAPTPTAAAELATIITIREIEETIDYYYDNLQEIVNSNIKNLKNNLSDSIAERMKSRMNQNIILTQKQIKDQESLIKFKTKSYFDSIKHKIENNFIKLEKNNPLEPLDRGFALIFADNNFVSSSDSLKSGDTILIKRKYQQSNAEIKE